MRKKYFTLQKQYMNFCIAKDMQYRMDFASHIITDVIFCFLKIAFVEIFFANTNSIYGYSKYEVMFIFGTSFVVISIYMMFSFFSHVDIPKDIRTGYMDILLTKPVSPFFLLSFRVFNIGGLGGMVYGVFLVVYAGVKMDLRMSAFHFLLYILLILSGTCIYFSISFILFTVAFWTQAAAGFIGILTDMGEAMKYPHTIYPKSVQIVLSFCFPVLMVASYPASIVMGKVPVWFAGINVVIGIVLLIGASLFLRKAISSYQSASS